MFGLLLQQACVHEVLALAGYPASPCKNNELTLHFSDISFRHSELLTNLCGVFRKLEVAKNYCGKLFWPLKNGGGTPEKK